MGAAAASLLLDMAENAAPAAPSRRCAYRLRPGGTVRNLNAAIDACK